jgi:hypothetical protein
VEKIDGRRGENATYSGDAAHEPRAIFEGNFGTLLEFDLVRELALSGKVLDLGLAVKVPVLDVRRPPDAQRLPGEDERRDDVAEARAADEILVLFRRARLDGSDKTGADPCKSRIYSASSHTTRRGYAQTASAPHMRFAASPRPSYTAPAPITYMVRGNLWPLTASTHAGRRMSDARRDVARVLAALAGLHADEVHAGLEGLGDVLWVPDHVHDLGESVKWGNNYYIRVVHTGMPA